MEYGGIENCKLEIGEINDADAARNIRCGSGNSEFFNFQFSISSSILDPQSST